MRKRLWVRFCGIVLTTIAIPAGVSVLRVGQRSHFYSERTRTMRQFKFSGAALLCGAFAALMLVVGSARAQNLLTNPDLDVTSVSTQVNPTPTGWNASASRTVSGSFNDGMSSE